MLIARMAAKSSGAAGSVYTLSGTAGSPNLSTDIQTFPTDASCGWTFNTDGTIDYSGGQFQTGVEWTSDQPTPAADMWVRATQSSGDAPTAGTLGSFLKVAGTSSSNRTWTWTVTGLGTLNGTLKMELCTVGDGSNIVATGYYRGNTTVESGA